MRDQPRMQRFENKEDLLFAFEKITLSRRSQAVNQSKGNNRQDYVSSKNTVDNDNNRESKNETENAWRFSDIKNNDFRNKKRCYNCGVFGHMATHCKKEKKPRGACFCCNSTDHIIANCPQNVQRKNYRREVNNISVDDKLN